MPSIDLNADLGEGAGSDDALLELISSASIACGGHAGDTETMRRTLAACRQRGIRAGAHPGYADRERFGRFRVVMPIDHLLDQVRTQLSNIRTIAGELDVRLAYVKLHGALANQASEDLALGVGIFGVLQGMDAHMAALTLDNSMQVRAARALGMPVIREAYADRAYTNAGLLVQRTVEGAVIEDKAAVVERCLRLAEAGEIVSIDGKVLRSGARSICLHGDTPGAVALARAVRDALESAGITIEAVAAEPEARIDLGALRT